MKIHATFLTALFTLTLGACDQAASPGGEDPGRVALGKADHVSGSCAATDAGPTCGGPAPVGNCWCDDKCEAYGDCCVDSFDECGVGTPEPAVSQCFNDSHCDPGQTCAGGVCINLEPDCDDGSSLSPFCDIKPGCPEGQTAAVINSCFQCVDESTCEPPPVDCDDGSSLSPFCDIKPGCDDGQTAAVINSCFQCVDENTCEPPPVDCDDGSSLSPFCDIKPVCADGEVAAIIGSCFQCVDALSCA